MADSRLTELASQSNLINSDLLYVVRNSDSKNIRVSSIVSSLSVLLTFKPENSSSTSISIETILKDIPSILSYGAVGDDSTDNTIAFRNALANEKDLFVPDGIFQLGTVSISSSLNLHGTGTLKLKNNYDQDNASWAAVDTAMFDVQTSNAIIKFYNLTFDGNEANQLPATPSLSLIRSWNKFSSSTSNLLDITIKDCTFKNQTFGSITINGGNDTSSLNHLTVDGCIFLDGRKGIGKEDPASSSANGFTPFYIHCFDRVKLTATNNKFIFRHPVAAIGDYAPAGIRWTFSEASNNSEGASGIIQGNYFYRVGRKDQYYDGTSTGNNGLGCVDFYARGREIVVNGNTFNNCFNSAIRGKTNVNKAVISNNIIENTPLAINIGPPTYESQLGYISIVGNVIRSTDYSGITVVGLETMNTPYVNSVSIVGNVIDTINNVDGIIGNNAGISVRYHDKVVIANNVINNIIDSSDGIVVRNNISCSVLGNSINNILNGRGIYFNNSGEKATANDNIISNINGYGITFSSNSSTDIICNNNNINNTVDYGIVMLSGNTTIYSGNHIDNISGLSRGMYVHASSNAVITGNFVGTGVTTQLFHTSSGYVQQSGNNFNPTISYGTAAPTTGTWRKGDIRYNTNPASAAFLGWICTVAGSPGTWNTFGSIT